MDSPHRPMFMLIVAVVFFVLGALLAFSVFGTATVPQLLGIMFIGLTAFATAHVP